MLATIAKWAAAPPLVLVALILLYGLAALACALAPFGGRLQAVDGDGLPVFVCASLAHTDIFLPLRTDAGDLRSAFFAVVGEVADDAYIGVGWGDLGFYRETPRWADLRFGTAFRAFAGLGPATLRVRADAAPASGGDCVRIVVDRAGRQALARFIMASAENDASGFPRLIDAPRAGEAFYAAKGRYSPWRTCNVWTSQALAAAGMPAAAWAPFSFGVTWPLLLRGQTKG